MRQLTEEGGLLERAVLEQKKGNSLTRESNKLAKKNSRMLRLVVLMFLVSAVVLLAVGGLAWAIFSDVRVVERGMSSSVTKQDQMIEDVKELVKSQKDTKTAVDDAKQAQDEKATIEIVPEEDPEKAKKAPLKLKYTPGKKPTKKGDKPDGPHLPAPTQTAVEVPLPVKDAKVLDAPEE